MLHPVPRPVVNGFTSGYKIAIIIGLKYPIILDVMRKNVR